ncbi:MAG: hypothetical protein ACP5H2_02095 [Solirubrobacteraceae bacterium]
MADEDHTTKLPGPADALQGRFDAAQLGKESVGPEPQGSGQAADADLPTTAKILPFPRDWFGPLDELVSVFPDPPSDSSAALHAAQSARHGQPQGSGVEGTWSEGPGDEGTGTDASGTGMVSAASFWGEDADALHQVVQTGEPLLEAQAPAFGTPEELAESSGEPLHASTGLDGEWPSTATWGRKLRDRSAGGVRRHAHLRHWPAAVGAGLLIMGIAGAAMLLHWQPVAHRHQLGAAGAPLSRAAVHAGSGAVSRGAQAGLNSTAARGTVRASARTTAKITTRSSKARHSGRHAGVAVSRRVRHHANRHAKLAGAGATRTPAQLSASGTHAAGGAVSTRQNAPAVASLPTGDQHQVAAGTGSSTSSCVQSPDSGCVP